MGADLDIPSAVVVLDLEADLIEGSRAITKRDPADHADLWARGAKALWSKMFLMAQGEQLRDRPPMPVDLPHELRERSPRQAAIRALARARVAVSAQPDNLEVEAERLTRNVDRYLETPEGRAHKAYIDRHLRP